MTLATFFIDELLTEAETTRRVLSRVPDDKLSWKPHPRSMSLGQLALHTANVPGAIAFLLKDLTFDAPIPAQPEAVSRAELLTALDASVSHARDSLRGWSESDLRATWCFVREGRTLLSAPRAGIVRALMLNHWYHHRGQLTVYLRLLEVKVPSVYGPSADESPFG